MYIRFYLTLFVVYALALIYLSFLPFGFEVIGLEEIVKEFSSHSRLELGQSSLRELFANYFLYTPIGFFCFFSRQNLGNSRSVYFAAAFFALVISFTAELGQAFLPDRCASYLDIFVNVSGSVFGVGLAECLTIACYEKVAVSKISVFGDCIKLLIDSRMFTVILLLYLVAVVSYFVPSVVRIDEVVAGISNFAIVPFTDFQKSDYGRVLINAALKVIIFFPIGLGVGVLMQKRIRRAKYFKLTWLQLYCIFIFLALSIELLQLSSSNYTASISDSCVYLVGLMLGVSFYYALKIEAIRWRSAKSSKVVKLPLDILMTHEPSPDGYSIAEGNSR